MKHLKWIIGDDPDLYVGDRITVILQVREVLKNYIYPEGHCFWQLTLQPVGRPLTFAAGPPIHIEADVEREQVQ